MLTKRHHNNIKNIGKLLLKAIFYDTRSKKILTPEGVFIRLLKIKKDLVKNKKDLVPYLNFVFS